MMTLAVALCLSAAAEAPPLRVGCGQIELIADDDMVIAGGIGAGHAKGQEGKLRAQAVVIAGGEKLAIVVADVLMARRDRLDRAVERCARECGIPAANILVSATHTHHAPATCTIHGYPLDERFTERLEEAIALSVKAADRACSGAGLAEFAFWLGEESSVGQNSRLALRDGTIFWVGSRDDAVRPTGPFDPELPVLIFREAGTPRAILWNHSTHNIGTLGGAVRSPGIYGLSAREIETKTGAQTMFVAGAFGSTHNLAVAPAEAAARLSAAVERALAKARPPPAAPLRAIKREFAFRVRSFDEKAEDEAVAAYCRKRLSGEFAEYTIDVFRAMRRELAPKQGEERRTILQAMRIGDVALVAAPGELFTSLGVEIKRRSPFRFTYVAGVANDWIGYIPDAEAYALGGYQLWTGLHSYAERGTGERMVEELVRMLEELSRSN